VNSVPEQHVLTNGNRQGVGALKHHSNLFANLDQLNGRVIDVFTHDIDAAGDADITETFIDPVNAAQKGALTATGRADHRGDDALLDVQVDIEQRLERAVPEIQFLRSDGQAGTLICLRSIHQPNLPST
jgi:hypothetical protein